MKHGNNASELLLLFLHFSHAMKSTCLHCSLSESIIQPSEIHVHIIRSDTYYEYNIYCFVMISLNDIVISFILIINRQYFSTSVCDKQ